MAALEERLTKFEQRTEERFAALAEAQRRTEEQVEKLAAALVRLDARVADLRGWQLELRYKERAGAYFGPLLRGLRVFSPHELEDELEPRLSAAEFKDLLQLDLLLRGQPRQRPESPVVWLAVEVSGVVEQRDVERAQRRAAALQRAGYRVIPTVAGEEITAEAKQAARASKMLVIQNGRPLYWKAALETVLAD